MKRITIEIPESKYEKLMREAEKLLDAKAKMCRLAGVEFPKVKPTAVIQEAAEYGCTAYVFEYLSCILDDLTNKINLLEAHNAKAMPCIALIPPDTKSRS